MQPGDPLFGDCPCRPVGGSGYSRFFSSSEPASTDFLWKALPLLKFQVTPNRYWRLLQGWLTLTLRT